MAGPNGSGKSTVLRAVRNNFYSGPFVNADEIEKSFRERGFINVATDYLVNTTAPVFAGYMSGEGKSWKNKAAGDKTQISLVCEDSILLCDRPNAYDAAVAADFIRHQLVRQNQSFTFETVMSHVSKIAFLEFTKQQGYRNYLYFICTASPLINVRRIAQRVRFGGHAVPEEKTRKRYFESLAVLPQVIPHCYRCFFFDNSSPVPSIDPIATIDPDGKLSILTKGIPWWFDEFVVKSFDGR